MFEKFALQDYYHFSFFLKIHFILYQKENKSSLCIRKVKEKSFYKEKKWALFWKRSEGWTKNFRRTSDYVLYATGSKNN